MSLKQYTLETQSIMDEFNVHYFGQDTSAADSYQIAVGSLWSIVSDNVTQINENIEQPHAIYSVAASVRLILECLADATYLSDHKEESDAYISSQNQISEELNRRGADNYESVFIDGTANRFGQLREKRTVDRISAYLTQSHLGDYNMLCFYCHPNLAALTWTAVLGQNQFLNLFMLNLATYLTDILKLLDNPAPELIHMPYVSTRIIQAADNYLVSTRPA